MSRIYKYINTIFNMARVHLLSVSYDDWVRDKSRRGTWRVTVANKLVEEILRHTPDAHVTRMHNDEARYDSIRGYLNSLIGTVGSNDYLWLQYNGHGNNFVGHTPIDLLPNWDERGKLPFTGENSLMRSDELLEKLSRIRGLKFILMDSCCADIGITPPTDTVYVAAAASDVPSHGDLSAGVIHPTLSRYSIPDIAANGAYQMWSGLEFEFGERSIVRTNIVNPDFRVTKKHDLPSCQKAQEFYEILTGEKEIIMRRFLPGTTVNPKMREYFGKLYL